jgi:hypothetical protein
LIAESVAKEANYPEICYFTVAGRPAYHPTDLIAVSWRVVSSQTAEWISAVAFYFARKVQQQTHIPIGLVVDAVGGTPAEAWTSAADAWAETRESQALAAATVPGSCLAVTIDTGDPDSLHPKEKEPVGDRLARCAQANYYHQYLVDSGPTPKSVQRKPGSIVLHFAHTDGGLVVEGDKLG